MIKICSILLLAVLLNGCSTLVAHVAITADEVNGNYEPDTHARTYCGTRFHWETFQNTGHQGGNVMVFFLLPDLVLSAAADTILVPITWPYDILKSSDSNEPN